MNRHPRSLSSVLGTAFALALAFSTFACSDPEPMAAAASSTSAEEHRVDVPAVSVAPADLESSLQISGSLQPHTRVAVMARLPGTLSRVSVNIGDVVRRGQVIASLDRREIDAQVDAAVASVNVARAALESADAALANAELERERTSNLFDKGAVPRQRLDAAETAARASKAQRELANANLAQTDAALRRAKEIQRDATLTSPITGVVVERNFDAGSFVSPNDKEPVVAVADLSVLKLQAGVSELEAGRLHVGMPARVTAQARPGEVFEGSIAAIAPEVDAKNRHFAIEIRTANPGTTLLSGMYAVATVPLERAAATLAVPKDAITSRDGKRVVLRIGKNVVTEVPITEGLTDGSSVQITSGLASGDVVIADARGDVVAGTRVNPVFAK